MSAHANTAADPLWRAVLVLGGLAVVAGVVAAVLALAAGVGFAETGVGARVWWFHHANPLGGLLTAGVGLVAIAAGLTRSGALAFVAGAALLGLGVAVPLGQATGANVVGGSASTVALCLGIGGGLLACALTARVAQR